MLCNNLESLRGWIRSFSFIETDGSMGHMKNDLLIQYGAMRETIKANVDTISRLFKQADSLKRIIETVTDTAAKQTLSQEVLKIDETVGRLIVQTNDLFDKYEKFVETVFTSR